jgi:hypothetical protein
MIAARQLDYNYIGKLIQGPHNQPARRMITPCCNKTQRVGRPQKLLKRTASSRTYAYYSKMSH